MMRAGYAAIYMAWAAMASATGALAADWSAVEALREGDMKKLVFHAEPRPLPGMSVVGPDGAETALADLQGEWLVVNLWATWCAPCRKEMPMLASLQETFADAPVEVVTIATGRNSVEGITRFFAEIGVDNLPEYRDPTQELARAMGILGLPVTLIVDPQGREIARLIGDAHWDSESAVAILTALAEEFSGGGDGEG